MVVTDATLAAIAEAPVYAIHQSDEMLAGMDGWNTATHGASRPDRARARVDDDARPTSRRRCSTFLKPLRRPRQVADVRQLDLPGPPLHGALDAEARGVLPLSQPRRQHVEGALQALEAGGRVCRSRSIRSTRRSRTSTSRSKSSSTTASTSCECEAARRAARRPTRHAHHPPSRTTAARPRLTVAAAHRPLRAERRAADDRVERDPPSADEADAPQRDRVDEHRRDRVLVRAQDEARHRPGSRRSSGRRRRSRSATARSARTAASSV